MRLAAMLRDADLELAKFKEPLAGSITMYAQGAGAARCELLEALVWPVVAVAAAALHLLDPLLPGPRDIVEQRDSVSRARGS